MSPRPDVSEERKKQIMDAAEHVFTAKGFDDARMDDIAEEIGLSKATIYLYYKSKDDLIIAILERIFQGEFGEMEAPDLTQVGAVEALWLFTEIATAEASAMLRLIPVTYEFLGLAFRNETVGEALKQYFKRYMTILIPIVERGVETGEFRPVDARSAAIAIGAIFEGTILLWAYDHSAVDPVENIRASIGLLLEGLQARP